MKSPRPIGTASLFAFALITLTMPAPILRAADGAPVVAKPEVNAAVTVTDNGRSWTLDNGIVKATINKSNGNMTSLVYRGINTMGGGGYWEETPQGAPQLTPKPSRSIRQKMAGRGPR